MIRPLHSGNNILEGTNMKEPYPPAEHFLTENMTLIYPPPPANTKRMMTSRKNNEK